MWNESTALLTSFLCAIEDACAEHRIPCPGGHAIVDSHRPLLWDANHLRVETPQAPDGERLADAADRHLGAGSFRVINVLHERAADDLRGSLTDHGYSSADQSLMVLGPTPRPQQLDIAVRDVLRHELTPSRWTGLEEVVSGRAREAAEQLVTRDAIVATVVREQCFGVIECGEVAAHCQLYSDGLVAQIEHVYTLPEYRRRGYGTALVDKAARVARSAGHPVVFILAEAESQQQRFCEELGFVATARLPRFVRLATASSVDPYAAARSTELSLAA